jgi:hypothetical protein
MNQDNREYLDEWRELIAKNPREVLEAWTEWDGSYEVRTVEDRRYAVAGIFAIEGWAIPPSMDEYIL